MKDRLGTCKSCGRKAMHPSGRICRTCKANDAVWRTLATKPPPVTLPGPPAIEAPPIELVGSDLPIESPGKGHTPAVPVGEGDPTSPTIH
jgi:hypothetical protein